MHIKLLYKVNKFITYHQKAIEEDEDKHVGKKYGGHDHSEQNV